ncbi:MAG TPA: non-homologous end-joining DNA ligase [Dermatophilaceae bacterium]|nr:non-homologous end-joining DNA ligase [Dermatophilaceae bacterium]
MSPAQPPKQVVNVVVDGRQLQLSNLDKVMYPASETTKGEVLNYYARIAPTLLPLLAGRPVTRIRWPHGTDGPSFFEKNLPPGAPSWLRSVSVPSSGSRTVSGADTVTYPFVDGTAALTYLVNLASLELHVPQWRFAAGGTALPPDRLVIDLDPGSPAGLAECATLALLVRDRLADLGLSCAPVTSGSKGMQVYAALASGASSDQVRDTARAIAQDLTRAEPDLVVWRMTKSLRPGKVLLDWSQNTAAKTTISPYSLRGKQVPYVAAPRTWAEIEAGAGKRDGLRQLDLHEVLERHEEHGDVFTPLLLG